jgi:hypothetical protein
MTEFREQDLSEACWERVILRGATFTRVSFTDARMRAVDVLTVRADRQAMVRPVMDSLTDEQLAATVTRAELGWPRAENLPVKECLRVVLNEEWAHRLYAERDLTTLEKEN